MSMTEKSGGIILVGLGPGDARLLTREAWDLLNEIPEIYLRTRQHPAVAGFPASLEVHSFDKIYEKGERFEQVYAQIIQKVLELGRRPEGVVYAVPGHPFVAETTGPEIARLAKEEGLPVRVIEGLSFIEPTFTALGVDPFPGLVLLDALDLAALHTPGYPVDRPALITQVYSRQAAADVKLSLGVIFPDEHRVRLVHAAGSQDELVEDLALYEIDRSPHVSLLTALYIPPLGADMSLDNFQEIVAHLRAPEGCPWDKEQTLQSLGPDLLDETYEALEALDANDMDGLCEELGDVLLLIAMLAQIANEEGAFRLPDVIHGVHSKIIRRHPHVFGNERANNAKEVLVNWEKLKEDERKANGKPQKPRDGILDGVSRSLPALSRSQQYQERAARVGFDWPDIEGVLDKIREEWQEVSEAQTPEELEMELGDLLTTVVNLIRWKGLDAETALRKANQRFYERFHHIETRAKENGRNLSDLSLDEMEAFWQEAKGKGKESD